MAFKFDQKVAIKAVAAGAAIYAALTFIPAPYNGTLYIAGAVAVVHYVLGSGLIDL